MEAVTGAATFAVTGGKAMTMRKLIVLAATALLLGACAQIFGPVDRAIRSIGEDPPLGYAEAVAGLEPIYCYRSLASFEVDCYKAPFFPDERRFVNYYGPPPDRYGRPGPAPRRSAK